MTTRADAAMALLQRARVPIAALALSAAGLIGIAIDEGYTDRAVQPLPGDKWTQGFGSTTRADGAPVQPGDRTTPPQALQVKLRDLRQFEGELRGCVTTPLTQGEYDSLVSLAYNVGAGPVCRSTMVRLHNAGHHAAACAQFDRWTYFQGRDCRDPANKCTGLAKRRARERAMCEGRAP